MRNVKEEYECQGRAEKGMDERKLRSMMQKEHQRKRKKIDSQ